MGEEEAASAADAEADFCLDHKVQYDEPMGVLRCPACGGNGDWTQAEAADHARRRDGTRGCQGGK